MLVKPGDKVRIGSDLIVNKIYNSGSKYDNDVLMRESMMKYCGQIVEVDFSASDGYDLFLIKEDNHLHVWGTGMVEVLPYSELKVFLKGVSDV